LVDPTTLRLRHSSGSCGGLLSSLGSGGLVRTALRCLLIALLCSPVLGFCRKPNLLRSSQVLWACHTYTERFVSRTPPFAQQRTDIRGKTRSKERWREGKERKEKGERRRRNQERTVRHRRGPRLVKVTTGVWSNGWVYRLA